MRTTINLLSIFLISFFITLSCTHPYYQVLKDYKHKKIKTGKFVIIPPNYSISNKDDVLDDFGVDDSSQVFKDYFYDKFIHGLYNASNYDKSMFSYDLPVRKSIMEIKNLPLNSELIERELTIYDTVKITLRLPKDSEKIHFSDEVNYILFMDTIKVIRKAATSGNMTTSTPGTTVSTPAGPTTTPGGTISSGGTFPFLFMTVDYAIWDNNLGQLIAFGKAKGKKSFMFVLEKGDWQKAIEDLTTAILFGSPFSWR